ncbi:MAG: hypothetical protein WAS21_23165 [Geminicoccaceae bacterium]
MQTGNGMDMPRPPGASVLDGILQMLAFDDVHLFMALNLVALGCVLVGLGVECVDAIRRHRGLKL